MNKTFNYNLNLIPIMRFFMVMGILMWSYIFPIYLRSLGASDMAIAFGYALWALGFSIFQFFGGHIADKFNKKKVIIILTIIFPFLFFGMSLIHSYILLIGLYFLYSILNSILFPVMTGLMTNSVDNKELNKAFSRYQAYFIMGFGLGPIVGYYLLKIGFNPSELFKFCAGFFVITFLIALFGIKNIKSTDQIVKKKREKFKLNKKLKNIFILGIFFYTLLQMTLFGPIISMFMSDIIKLKLIYINYLFGIGGFFAAIYSIFVGKYITMKNGFYFFFLSEFFHFFFLLIWIMTKLNIFFILGWIVVQTANISLYFMLTYKSNKKEHGKIIGYFGTITGIIPAFFAPLFMAIKNHYGYLIVFLIAFPIIFIQLFFRVKEENYE